MAKKPDPNYYDEGAEAFRQGKITANCPYRGDAGDEWRDGYRDAQDDEARKRDDIYEET